MIRSYDIVLMSCVLVAAGTTFWVKYDSNEVRSEIRALEKRISEEEAAIELGEAEWSVLTQPDRVQSLIGVHAETLALRPMQAEQLVAAEALATELDALAPATVEDALADLIGSEGEQ